MHMNLVPHTNRGLKMSDKLLSKISGHEKEKLEKYGEDYVIRIQMFTLKQLFLS
jgi:hypothetical protein